MNENEYFDSNGHLSDAAFSALASGKQLDELTRLEMAEHLSFCDKCVESCDDATQSGELAEPDGSCLLDVRRGLRRIKRSNLVHRAATAALAAALALTLWFTGMFDIDVGKTSGVFNNIDSGLSSLCDSISSFGRSLIDALGNFTDLISFERNTDYEE